MRHEDEIDQAVIGGDGMPTRREQGEEDPVNQRIGAYW